MARDCDLLGAAEAGITGCRVYSWDGPWVSLGRFQSPEADLLPGAPVPWVMRPTGGKGVLHGHDLTIGLAMPAISADAGGGGRRLRYAYRVVVSPLVEALRGCGLPAAMGSAPSIQVARPGSSDCFAESAPNDIVDETTGRKVCGCALRFTRRATLLQASIPLEAPLIDPRLVFAAPADHSSAKWDSEGFPAALEEALRSSIIN